jgi:tetratricopeptide (TPR) repeat protein
MTYSPLAEAERLFDYGIQREPIDPYGYVGKVSILRQKIEKEQDHGRKAGLEGSALSFLEEAYELTHGDAIIAAQLGIQRSRLGAPESAIAILTTALKERPPESRIRDILVKLFIEREQYDRALEIASEGVLLDPTSWRLQRHVARLSRRLRHPIQAVKGHYEAAVRHRRDDVSLMVELGTFLFINSMYSEAEKIFSEARNLPVSGYEKRFVREWWRNEQGERIQFSGRVKDIRGASARVLILSHNFKAFFWRTRDNLIKLTERDEVACYVGFNAYGALGEIVYAQPKN